MKTQKFEKKGKHSSEKNYLTIFFRIIEHKKTQGTI